MIWFLLAAGLFVFAGYLVAVEQLRSRFLRSRRHQLTLDGPPEENQ